MIYHPEFFTDTMRWEIDGFSAPTIRALLAKLPPGSEVVDYLPGGYTAPFSPPAEDRWKSTVPQRHVMSGNGAGVDHRGVSWSAKRGGHHGRMKWDHEKILDAWAAGQSRAEIAAANSCTVMVVSATLAYRRKRHDPRAMTRYHRTHGPTGRLRLSDQRISA